MGTNNSKPKESAANAENGSNKAVLSPQKQEILKQQKVLDDLKTKALSSGDKIALEAYLEDSEVLKHLRNVEDSRELLTNMAQRFQSNLKIMQATRDVLNGMKSQPGEVKSLCQGFNYACKDGEEAERELNEFHRQANKVFNLNFDIQIKAHTPEELSVRGKELNTELKKLSDMNIKVQRSCQELEEKVRILKLENLTNTLKRKEAQLSSERLMIIGKGVVASLVVSSGVGLIVVAGVFLLKYGSEAVKRLFQSTGQSTAANFCLESTREAASVVFKWSEKYFDEFISVSRELEEIQRCQEELHYLQMQINPTEMATDEIIKALESVTAAANSCREHVHARVAERQEAMKDKQELKDAKEEITRLREELETVKRK